MGRIIGIRHRTKQTVGHEARPTEVCIIEDGGDLRKLKLETEDDELDFVHGRHPVRFRKAEPDEDLSRFPKHHIRKRKAKEEKTKETFVPAEYDGMQPSDRFAMILGGSGDRLAFALSRLGEKNGVSVYRIPPSVVKERRGTAQKDDDAVLLARLLQNQPELFYVVLPRDRDIIEVSEAFRARRWTMRDRIACGQRIRHQTIGRVFLNPEGGYEEGTIEDMYDRARANSEIHGLLEREEAGHEKDLIGRVQALPLWPAVFEGIEGLSPIMAGALIGTIQDIRRFIVTPDSEAFKQLRLERDLCLTQGNFQGDLDKVSGRLTSDMSLYQQVQIVRSWKRAQGKEDEAVLLDQALEAMKQANQLRRKARRRTVNRLVAYCGVHVRQGGRYADVSPEQAFPRKRTGGINWSPVPRQTLFLLGDQANYRPDSKLGVQLRRNKARYLELHPEPVAGSKGAKRFTPMHIHRTARWRTLTQFTREIGRRWLRFEEGQARANAGEPQPVEALAN